MSAPDVGLKRSEYINYSFLAIRSSNALKAALKGRTVQEDDRSLLERAASFLGDVSTGAEFIEHGRFHGGFNASRSVPALNRAMGPIKRLRSQMNNADVATFFGEMSDAVRRVSLGGEPDQAERLRQAIDFFDYFYETVANEVTSKHPPIGLPSNHP